MKRLLVLIGLVLTACGTVPQSHGGPVQDQVSLIDALRTTVTVDAHQIRADGSGTATTIVDWVAPPHLYLKGRVLVIYVGTDSAVLSLLQSLLGPQFAGS